MMNHHDPKFPLQLKAARKQHKMSQKQLAEILGVSITAVSSWETGFKKPQSKTAIRINEILPTETKVEVNKVDLTHVKLEDMFNEIKRRGFAVTYTM